MQLSMNHPEEAMRNELEQNWRGEISDVQDQLLSLASEMKSLPVMSRPPREHIEQCELAASNMPEWALELVTHWDLMLWYWTVYVEHKYKEGAPPLPVAPQTYLTWLEKYEKKVRNLDECIRELVHVAGSACYGSRRENMLHVQVAGAIWLLSQTAEDRSLDAEEHKEIFRDFYAFGRVPQNQRRRRAEKKSQKVKKYSQKAKRKSRAKVAR